MNSEKLTEYIQVDAPDFMRLGEYVTEAKGANRTMAQFAEECGIGASTLSRVVNGKIRKPLSENAIRTIYEHRDPNSRILFNTFMRINGMQDKEKVERDKKAGKINTREYGRIEEVKNRERLMKNAIVIALSDRDVPVVNCKVEYPPKIQSLYGMNLYYDFAFEVNNAPQQTWCFETFTQQSNIKMPLTTISERIMATMSRAFLMDAWSPELLQNKKISFVFCDRTLYENTLKQVQNAPIKSAMSMILVDLATTTVVEETWISTSPKTKSVLELPVKEKITFSEKDYWKYQDE